MKLLILCLLILYNAALFRMLDPVSDRERSGYEELTDEQRSALFDIKCFPVPRIADASVPDVTYTDSWNDTRSYGGERTHEGCDLMGDKMPPGFYPVISMTDGVVERAGWLNTGGFRIGIRSPAGAYIYYAHLDRYADNIAEGVSVHAGELLGFMGDSGYGAEGTAGLFPVHLHLGIYIRTDRHEDVPVDPYGILRRLENLRTCVRYRAETVVLLPGF